MQSLFRHFLVVASFAFAVAGTAVAAQSAKRIALVVGAGSYEQLTPLDNPVKDAKAVSKALWESGFEVIELIDPDVETLLASVQVFSDRMTNGDQAIFYFAGHGIQFGGENFLMAVDADLTTRNVQDILSYAVSTNTVANILGQSGVKLSVLILDACRNNPLADVTTDESGTRAASPLLASGASNGLAPIQTYGSQEILVSYATAPGSVALDGPEEGNSPFTSALVEHISTPDLEIGQVFRRVRGDVRRGTGDLQVPWVNSSLENDHILRDAAYRELPPDAGNDALGLLPPSDVLEQTVWVSAISSGRAEDFVGYAEQFPEGIHAEQALAYAAEAESSPTGTIQVRSTDFGISDAVPYRTMFDSDDGAKSIVVAAGTAAALPGWEEVRELGQVAEVLEVPRGAELQSAAGDVLEVGALVATRDLETLQYRIDTDALGDLGAFSVAASGQQGVTRRLRFTSTIDACDLVAGYQYDNDRVGRGVRWELMLPNLAITACRSAVARYPDLPRFMALYSRALRKAELYDLAGEWNMRAVDAGYIAAIGAEGGFWRRGFGREIDFEKAAFYYTQAMDLGDPNAMANLGELHLTGDGVPRDPEYALQLFQRSADLGNDWGLNLLGRTYLRGEGTPSDPVRAARIFQEAANMGSPPAKAHLARLYSKGLGVEMDADRAFRWWESAAGQGWAFAQAHLGRIYMQGELVPKDTDRGLYWIRRSAEANDPEGQYWLAQYLLTGDGVEKDAPRGLSLLYVAATRQHTRSIFQLAEMHEKGDLVEKNTGLALEFYLDALELGYSGAARRAAKGYLAGYAGEVEVERAIDVLLHGGRLGSAGALRDLARMFLTGDVVDADPERAAGYLVEAHALGNPYAARDLARLYAQGNGVPTDPDRAFRLMSEAAEADVPWAWVDLAGFHENAVGTEADTGAAAYWFARAAVSNDTSASDRAAELLERLDVEALISGVGYFAAGGVSAPDNSEEEVRDALARSGIDATDANALRGLLLELAAR